MKLSIFQRKTGRKSDAAKARREGNIPAILYASGQPAQPICVKSVEVQAAMRSIPQQLLATTVFELSDGQGERRALIKEVQYQPVTYAMEHIDFLLLSDEKAINVNVPIRLVGVAECAGVKLGGTIRPVIRSLKVRCLLRDLPKEFLLDVRELNIGQAKRLSDISLPQGVRPLAKMSEIAVIIAKKA